ncbi:LacI family DNA-binding transcriptional regulator [Dysgonomonas sp. 216]|uniref:LacI family DNA-binding transcriptional regulator n=1 Tax=Dysgonomonas sp. 216 TaxID=2302934 RepID=UPI0013CF6F3B|nr:substrate-binding domain-containing protein [Dysgonomonas sp. 216]NDW19104.1 LacI family DNA-binding transcriptional regulator [Dysgonomonas sp. 216]
MSEIRKNVRIIDIARMAKVSPGTVDRVLHNRGKVSADKREKVEAVLKEINYQPNIMARSLALKRHYKILVFVPAFEKGSYWDSLNRGIVSAARELVNFNISIHYLHFDQYDEASFTNQAKLILKEEYDAIVIAALFEKPVVDLSRALDEREIPYVYIDSIINHQNNLAYYGANSYDSGAVAAKLLMYDVGKDGDVFIANIRTNKKKDSFQTYVREKGFREYLSENNFEGQIFEIELSDNYAQTLRSLNSLIEKNPRLSGGVVFNSRVHELVDVLFDNTNLSHEIKLIGYDAIEKNVEALRVGKVSFLLSQRSDIQGYNGVKALSNYLLFGTKPDKTNYMPIDILIKENIDYYHNM